MAPLSLRKSDAVYLLFFAVHIVVMLNVDLYPLYPAALRPGYMTTLREWYITTYNDRFFSSPPAWFKLYLYFEALYHLPLSVWAIRALKRDDPRTPIHLLIYAVQTFVTTATCIADFISWTPLENALRSSSGAAASASAADLLYAQKVELAKLYVPYLAVSVLMGLDMYTRLARSVSVSSRRPGQIKEQ